MPWPSQWQEHWYRQRVAQPLDIWRQTLKQGGQADRLAAALALVHPRSLIVADWEQATPLWYAQQVEGLCPDCRIVQGFEHMPVYARRASEEGRPLYVARTLNQAADWSHPTAVGPLVYLARDRLFTAPAELNSLHYTFASQVTLLGYTWPLGEPLWRPGSVLALSLYWRGEGPSRPDYSLSLGLSGPRGVIWQHDETAPVLGMYPFSRLAPGEVIADYYEVPVPADATPGTYTLSLLLYRVLPDGGFLNVAVTDAQGRVVGDQAVILQWTLRPAVGP